MQDKREEPHQEKSNEKLHSTGFIKTRENRDRSLWIVHLIRRMTHSGEERIEMMAYLYLKISTDKIS